MPDRGLVTELRSPSSVRREGACLQGERRLADSNCCLGSEREVRVNPAQQEGFIYVAEAGGERIKIGWTTEPAERIRRLESAIAGELYVWACVPGTRVDEAAAHALWRDDALGAEWFHATDELRAWAESIEEVPADPVCAPQGTPWERQ